MWICHLISLWVYWGIWSESICLGDTLMGAGAEAQRETLLSLITSTQQFGWDRLVMHLLTALHRALTRRGRPHAQVMHGESPANLHKMSQTSSIEQPSPPLAGPAVHFLSWKQLFFYIFFLLSMKCAAQRFGESIISWTHWANEFQSRPS